MKHTNKADASIVAITLLLLVSSVGVFYVDTWYQNHASSVTGKFKVQNLNDYIYIKNIYNLDTYSQITISNSYSDYFIISEIKIKDQSCTLINSNVIVPNDNSILEVNCTFPRISQVELILISESGFYTQNLLVR